MKSVVGKVAFITGGASGIGLGMAKTFLRAGMKIVVADIRDDHLESARKELAAGSAAHFLKVDITDRAAMRAAADEAERVFGAVHVLCNNAGVSVLGPPERVEISDWEWILQVNLLGIVRGVRAFVPGLGVPEDPVTGSLAGGLGLWLPSTGVVGDDFVIRQGTALGRRGLVRVTREDGVVWVGGDTVVAVTGTVALGS